MPNIAVHVATKRQVEIAAESFAATLLSMCGYDVYVQYGAHQPDYDLVATKSARTIRISVKGSKDGGFMLATRQKVTGSTVRGTPALVQTAVEAIDAWERKQPPDTLFVFVGFMMLQSGQAPRAYTARLKDVALHLRAQNGGAGKTSLTENDPLLSPGSKYKNAIPANWAFTCNRVDTI